MSEQTSEALSLDDVSRRFADSERALTDARARLEGLATAEESAAASARSLEQSSAAVSEFVRTADALIKEVELAQRTAREVLEAGARFVDGSELRSLQDNMMSLSKSVSTRLDEIESRLGEVQARDDQIAELEAELARRTAKLSGRAKKQLGVD